MTATEPLWAVQAAHVPGLALSPPFPAAPRAPGG